MHGSKSNLIIDFSTEIIDKSHDVPIVVQFSAPSCGPCVWVEKQWIAIKETNKLNWQYFSLPVQDYKKVSEEYKVVSNPTSLLFVDGKVKAKLSGALPRIVVEQWLEDHLR